VLTSLLEVSPTPIAISFIFILSSGGIWMYVVVVMNVVIIYWLKIEKIWKNLSLLSKLRLKTVLPTFATEAYEMTHVFINTLLLL
jgi:hypothetical protein